MRNWTGCSGVYSNMYRMPLILICSLVAMAQQSPQQDPLETSIQAVWQARNNGRFEEAAAAMEQSRALLQRARVDSPRFASWVQQVVQLYQNSSLNAQARSVLQEAIARIIPMGDSNPTRIAMLSALGESWRQDGNLLKAVGYLEQAAEAAASPPAATQPAMLSVVAFGNPFNGVRYIGGDYAGRINAYSRLADLYQQLGRPDAVAGIAAKIRMLASNDETALARFYEQHGQLEEAAAIYKKLAEESQQAKANAWQSLANVYARQEHYTDAIAALQQAIEAAQSSEKPGIPSPTLWMRQNLVGYMRQANLLDQADQVYQQILRESQGEPQEAQNLSMYAQYLADTNRGAQGQGLLKDYLANGSSLDPQQKMNVLFSLANLARRAGDSKSADEYQQAGQALRPQPPPPPAGQIRIAGEMQKSQDALNQHRLDDAYDLVLGAIDAAPQAVDGQQVQWFVPQIADVLAANKQPAKADQLFQRLIVLAQNWKRSSVQPLLAVTQSYARFFMFQPDRWGEVQAAIEQYRSVLTDANGPDSGSLAEPLRMKIEFERSHSQWEQAENSARELLELQESLSGNTSDPYLRDLQAAAGVYQSSGDFARALPLYRKAITIADLLATPSNDWLRSQTRMDAALTLAHLGQFDEAEMMEGEAVALQRSGNAVRLLPLAPEVEEIRRMKQAAATASASRVDK